MTTVTPNVVKHTIARSHFRITKSKSAHLPVLVSVEVWFWFPGKSWAESFVMCVESHDWLGCWGHHMKSPGFKALAEHQKVRNWIRAAFLPLFWLSSMYRINCRSHYSCPSWTTSQERFRSAGKTDCGEICLRCKVALANESSAFFLGLLFFLRISSCSARPGRTAAPGRNGSSNLYVTVHRAYFWKRFWKSFVSNRKHGKNNQWDGVFTYLPSSAETRQLVTTSVKIIWLVYYSLLVFLLCNFSFLQ